MGMSYRFKQRSLTAALLLLSAGLAVTAQAAPVVFKDAPSAAETAIINMEFGSFISDHPGIDVKTSEVDLQGKGVASLIVKFQSDLTCTADGRCETAVLFFDRKKWSTVFEHAVKDIALAPSANLAGSNNMASFVVDGGIRWVWSGYTTYLPDINSLGTPFPKDKPASLNIGKLAASAISQLPDLSVLFQKGASITFTSSEVNLGAAQAVMVRAYSPGDCSNTEGCPHVLLAQTKTGVQLVWSGQTPGEGAVLATSTNGYRDIALASLSGYKILKFDGQVYKVSETSYPSKFTPAP
jgi:hypothetical protein